MILYLLYLVGKRELIYEMNLKKIVKGRRPGGGDVPPANTMNPNNDYLLS